MSICVPEDKGCACLVQHVCSTQCLDTMGIQSLSRNEWCAGSGGWGVDGGLNGETLRARQVLYSVGSREKMAGPPTFDIRLAVDTAGLLSLLLTPTTTADSALPTFIKGSRKKLGVCLLLPCFQLRETPSEQQHHSRSKARLQSSISLASVETWSVHLLTAEGNDGWLWSTNRRDHPHSRWAQASTCIL